MSLWWDKRWNKLDGGVAISETSVPFVYKLFMIWNCFNGDGHRRTHTHLCTPAYKYGSACAYIHNIHEAWNAAVLLRCLYSITRCLISINKEAITSWLQGECHSISVGVDQELTQSQGWRWRCQNKGSCNPFWGTNREQKEQKILYNKPEKETDGEAEEAEEVEEAKGQSWETNTMGDYAGFNQNSVWGITQVIWINMTHCVLLMK